MIEGPRRACQAERCIAKELEYPLIQIKARRPQMGDHFLTLPEARIPTILAKLTLQER